MEVERTDWRTRAACIDKPIEWFFPNYRTVRRNGFVQRTLAKHDYTQGLEVCSLCAVRARCLEWALDHDELYGLWGGKTERDRTKLRKARVALSTRAEAS